MCMARSIVVGKWNADKEDSETWRRDMEQYLKFEQIIPNPRSHAITRKAASIEGQTVWDRQIQEVLSRVSSWLLDQSSFFDIQLLERPQVSKDKQCGIDKYKKS